MRRTLGLIVLFVVPIILLYFFTKSEEARLSKLDKLRMKIENKETKPVDHSKFEELKVKFNSPGEVTAACLECHNERGKEVLQSTHFRWLRDEFIPGRGIVSTGKRNLINNHCISINGSEGTCNRCHAGYGYDSKHFDFNNPENIDCLICHDNSDVYSKTIAGMPKPGVDLNTAAMSAGKPTIRNCGPCHFDGGGGNNAKHGDLEQALYNADRNVDVHLASNGAGMECRECHTAQNHQIKGKLYTVSSMNRNRMLCEDCHTANPHTNTVLNEHTVKVACQTCHIPTYAKVNATKIEWDWSKAGKLKDGQPYVIHNADGNETYQSIKGEITWGKMLKPEYRWFNGTADHYFLTDTATVFPIHINKFFGSYDDPDAKIHPVKVMRTKQPYDPKLKKLLSPKLWDKDFGQGAFWKDFDWNQSLKKGMEYLGLPWSGEYTFASTESYWLINHMVSPKEESVKCVDCHQRNDSRLAAIVDIYIPGRDSNGFLDTLGIAMVIFTLIGTVVHGSLRIISNRKRKSEMEA